MVSFTAAGFGCPLIPIVHELCGPVLDLSNEVFTHASYGVGLETEWDASG